MISLYRKYRPQVFASVIGQEHIKQTLQNEIASNRISHAYLFAGPRAVGKTTTARIFACAINCEKRKEGTSEPCNECESCKSILDGRTLDLMEIDAASHTGVDNVRETIIAASRVVNMKLKYKVFILDEVHMLSGGAFNALLKTLEEPPASVVFILATTELHKVPATIISRCQRFDFKKIHPDVMLARLKDLCEQEKKSVADEILLEVVRRSDGCVRDAESLLGQILSLGEKKIDTELAQSVLPRSDYAQVIKLLGKIFSGKVDEALLQVGDLVSNGHAHGGQFDHGAR